MTDGGWNELSCGEVQEHAEKLFQSSKLGRIQRPKAVCLFQCAVYNYNWS